ncbi:MAG TPA: hypothetical protein VM261_15120 [Kofleriaceae bacterium]|nr:hypothetical protein [Kofleriaceae bacterium]
MLRLAAVAAAMALGWATLELRSMIERNEESVLAMAEAQPRPPSQPTSQPHPYPPRPSPVGPEPDAQRPAEVACEPERVDVDDGVPRTARAVEAALREHGLLERGRAWLGRLSAVGGGRDTLVFVPDGIDLDAPIQLVVYMEGHGSFADAAMEHRHASAIERLVARSTNVVYVAPDAPSSAHGNRTAKTPYWVAGCGERRCRGGHAAPGDFVVFLEQALAKIGDLTCADAAALDVHLHLVGFSNGGKGVWGAVTQLEAAEFRVGGRAIALADVVFADANYGSAWLDDTWRVLAARDASLTILVIDGSFTGTERAGGNRRRAAAFLRAAGPSERIRLVPLRASHHGVGDAAVDHLGIRANGDVLAGS